MAALGQAVSRSAGLSGPAPAKPWARLAQPWRARAVPWWRAACMCARYSARGPALRSMMRSVTDTTVGWIGAVAGLMRTYSWTTSWLSMFASLSENDYMETLEDFDLVLF